MRKPWRSSFKGEKSRVDRHGNLRRFKFKKSACESDNQTRSDVLPPVVFPFCWIWFVNEIKVSHNRFLVSFYLDLLQNSQTFFFFYVLIGIHTTYNTGMATYTIYNSNTTTKKSLTLLTALVIQCDLTNTLLTRLSIRYDAIYNTTIWITNSTVLYDYLFYLRH